MHGISGPVKFSLLLFLHLFVQEIRAQQADISFKHIKNENGLSNSTVEAIFQDSRGFIWFGTRDGLNRFDGYQVQVYRQNAADSNTICDNYITSITEDKQKNLWIGTLNGVSRFNPVTNSFKNYKHDDSNPRSLSKSHITSVFCDAGNRIWLATSGGGLNQFNPFAGIFSRIPVFADLTHNREENTLHTIFEDSKGNLWTGTASGLSLYNSRSGSFEPARGLSTTEAITFPVRSIAEDKAGNLLLGTDNNGLIVYNAQYRTQKSYIHQPVNPNSLSSNLIRSLLVTRNGTVWTGSVNGGLDLFDPQTGKFFNYQYQPDHPGSLSQRTVSALFEDKQGNIWIGTHRGGVNLYMPGAEKFKLYRQKPESNSLSYNDVKAFCEDRNGNIWIGTDGGGLNLFKIETNTFSHFKYSPFDAKSIGSNEVISITEDSDGDLWIGTWGGGLCLYNPKPGNFSRYNNSPSYIQSIFEDSNKNLWIATYFNGLHLFDKKTGGFKRITKSKTGKTALSGNNILSIAEDKENNLWIGTDDGGLNRMDGESGEFSQYFNKEEKTPDLRVLFVDSKDNIWVGQWGLYCYNREKDGFAVFTEKANLGGLFVKGIVEDNNGNLWISTSTGITRLNPETREVRIYNTVDGLQGKEFEANAFLRTRAGQVFFGGVDGFNSFYPNEITTNTFIPPVYVTDFMVQNKKVSGGRENLRLPRDVSFTDTITLSYKEATFSFGFAALNFTASENNQFVYKLQNWDKEWVDAGSERKASYTNVSPGSYTFTVKASNNDGLWNENGYTINIIITPPFYQTWWFRLLVGAIILIAGFYFYRFRRRVHLSQIEESKKEELHLLQLQFFTNISHEFRTPLSLITGPVEKLLRENPDSKNTHSYQVIQRNANRLLQLINELMDFRKAESGALKLQVMPGSIPVFINEIAEEFSELAIQKKIDFKISVTPVDRETWFDRQVLEKIIINLLSNSFKYTPDKGIIQLRVFDSLENFTPSFENELIIENNARAERFLYFCISDNGIGISKESIGHLFVRYYRVSDSHLGSGIGLAFVKTLTELHKGNIYVYSQPNKGTELIIAIPSEKSDYLEGERWMQAFKQEPGSKNPGTKPVERVLMEDIKRSAVENKRTIDHVVLIADDHEELRSFIRDSLKEQYTVIEAADGKAAMEKTIEFIPDIIISDIMMPGIDGIEFCEQVKKSPETAHIPFILLTAKTSIDARIEGTDTGADYFFSKPLNTELLLLTIRNILAQKQKLRERYQRDQHAEIKELAHSVKDKEFVEELIELIERNLSVPAMDIDFICMQIGMSRTKLYNRVKNITGQSIGDFIRSVRLRKAASLMTRSDMSLTDVMYSVGIQTQSYFSKAFKNEFGKTPTQFLKEAEAKK